MLLDWVIKDTILSAQAQAQRRLYMVIRAEDTAPDKYIAIKISRHIYMIGFYPTTLEATNAAEAMEGKYYEAELLASLEKGE